MEKSRTLSAPVHDTTVQFNDAFSGHKRTKDGSQAVSMEARAKLIDRLKNTKSSVRNPSIIAPQNSG